MRVSALCEAASLGALRSMTRWAASKYPSASCSSPMMEDHSTLKSSGASELCRMVFKTRKEFETVSWHQTFKSVLETGRRDARAHAHDASAHDLHGRVTWHLDTSNIFKDTWGRDRPGLVQGVEHHEVGIVACDISESWKKCKALGLPIQLAAKFAMAPA